MITASQLIDLLRVRHLGDVFVPECKDGGTWDRQHLRLDAWAMLRSWKPWTTIAYEVKVSRSDFIGDQKWPAYLPLCHELYFVCPAKLIDPTELPPSVGLLWTIGQGTGQRLVCKRKAVRREPDVQALSRLMAYTLMSRSVIVKGRHDDSDVNSTDPTIAREMRMRATRAQVEHAEKRKVLARLVRSHIHRREAEMRGREAAARDLDERARNFADRLKQIGISWDPDAGWAGFERSLHQIERIAGGVSDGEWMAMVRAFDAAQVQIQRAQELLQSLRQASDDKDGGV